MTIKNLSEFEALPQWTTRKTQVICVNVIEETHDVKTFQFIAEPKQLFHFKPGQFIGIQIEVDGEKHNRSYTIASSPTRPHLLELTIKKDPEGAVSPWLHENIVPGKSLELRGPAGRFNCMDVEFNPKSDKVLLISAGSGITPMMSMARFWCDQATQRDIQFLHWSRSTGDIIFRRELALLDHQYDRFNPEIICTNPGLSENWLGRRGRVNLNLLTDLVKDIQQYSIFCCGPEGFMSQVKSCLEQINFDMSYYHDESFDPGGKKKAKDAAKKLAKENLPTPKPLGPFTLTLEKSGKTLVVEPNENLLDRLESENVAIESACRAGNCGCCQVKKISGETTTLNETGLLDERKHQGFILTCTTCLKSDVTLDI